MTLTYILSQVFVVLCYIGFAVTYLIKNRYLLLSISILSLVFSGASYILLDAWAGLAVTVIAIMRNIVFMIQEKFEGDKDYTIMDWIVYVVLMVASAVCAYFTFDGCFSLFSVVGAALYTTAGWQHNLTVYRILCLLASACTIVYFVFIWSLFGFILESAMFVFMLIVAIVYFNRLKKEKVKETKNG